MRKCREQRNRTELTSACDTARTKWLVKNGRPQLGRMLHGSGRLVKILQRVRYPKPRNRRTKFNHKKENFKFLTTEFFACVFLT